MSIGVDDLTKPLARQHATQNPGGPTANSITPPNQNYGQTALTRPARTIIERIIHIRNEIEQLDAELGKLQSDIAGRIGGGYHK